MLDANNLRDAFRHSKKGVSWKESVQRYEINELRNINQTVKTLSAHDYKQLPFYEFKLNERGKTRHIMSLHISDRVVNRAVCDYILAPNLLRYLIYDNGASVKGKGCSFTQMRLDRHLHHYFMTHGTNKGYILLVDFSKYFDNIDHEKLLDYLRNRIDDEEAMVLIAYMISTFEIDVSYMSDEEYDEAKVNVFNSLEYYQTVADSERTGKKFLRKSLGIGSQISQVSGISYPTPIDNYCTIVRGVHEYARYMDDSYAIHQSKEFLRELLDDLVRMSADLGIHINMKKTQICPLTAFTFLKVKYMLTPTGAVIHRPARSNITRERTRLKKNANMVENGKLSFDEATNAYASWKGNAQKYNASRSIENMDKLYNELFINPFIEQGSENPRPVENKPK